MNVLLSSIQELTISEHGVVLLKSTPIEVLFSTNGSNRNNSVGKAKPPKISKLARITERSPMTLKFDNTWAEGMYSDLKIFGLNYNKYYKNECESDLNKIRKIKSISITGATDYRVSDCISTVKYFQPNYASLIFRSCKLEFFRLNRFCHVFHENLTRLEVYQVNCNSENGHWITFECLKQAAIEGKYLRINKAVIDEFYENETENIEIKRLLFDKYGDEIDSINEDITMTSLAENESYEMDRFENFSSILRSYIVPSLDEYWNEEFEEENAVFLEKVKLYTVCWNVISEWLLKFIDNKAKEKEKEKEKESDNHDQVLKEEQKHKPKNKQKENDKQKKLHVAECEEEEEKGDVHGRDDGMEDFDAVSNNELEDKTGKRRDVLALIVRGKHKGKIEELIFNDGTPNFERCEELFGPFNGIFQNKVCYRLLNWQNTVRVLKISFVVAYLYDIRNREDVQLWKEQFRKVMHNIFEYFDNLKHVIIEIKISTKHSLDHFDDDELSIDLSCTPQLPPNENVDNNCDHEQDNTCKIGMNESSLDALHCALDEWMKLIYDQFKFNFDKIIEKYGKTSDSFFKFSFFVTIGDLTNGCDNPSDMFEYLYQKQEIQRNIFQNREQSVVTFKIESNNANNINQSMDQKMAKNRKQFFTTYWDELKTIKTMILSVTKYIDIYQESFTVWKSAMIKSSKL